MTGQQNFRIREKQVSYERIDGELILISMDTGKYFSASGTAADIFFLLSNAVPQHLWGSLLTPYFSSALIQEDIDAFIAYSLQEKLIEETFEVSNSTLVLPMDYQRSAWVKPEIIEFSDLQDLILVDPVHDTSLEGWPVERS